MKAIVNYIFMLGILLILVGGCKEDTPYLRITYGIKDNELKVGKGLKEIVNASNEFVFAPWCKKVEKDARWGKYKVKFKKLLSLRDKPLTYAVILAICEPINKENPKISWIYRDDFRDGHIYKKLVLQNGIYMIAYKINPKDKSISIKSIKK